MITNILCKWIKKREVRVGDILAKIDEWIDKHNIIQQFFDKTGIRGVIFIMCAVTGFVVVNAFIERDELMSNWWYLLSPLLGLLAIAGYLLVAGSLMYAFIYLAFNNKIVGAIFIFTLNILIGIGDVCNFIIGGIAGSILRIKIAECKVNKKHKK